MADLTVTITESVTLNGAARGSSNALTVSGINDVYHRVITCPDDSQVAVATFKSTLNNTTEQVLDMELVKYIRITNLDASNPIILNLMIDTNEDDSAADKSASIQIEAKKSFVYGSTVDSIDVDDDAATINSALSSLVDLRSIVVDPLSEAVQVEVFIASA
jgi:formylmethanofuran dehydrogenase subunit B